MGAQKHGSKGGSGGGYVGGFLNLFDWNAKARKKLFSSKSESPELPKQTKRTNGNTPSTRFNTMEEDEMITGFSLKGSSDYSCATSVTDEDGYGTKAPGVVARLMGLDSLPTYNFSDTYSNPSYDSQSLRDMSAFYIRKEPEFESMECEMESVPRPTKAKPRAIEKFQTETLPPKSAKSIPITRHNLLSPIKSSSFVSSNNPARIMEAASRIPLVGSSSSFPSPSPSSSSSVPFRVKASREKMESSARKPKLPEAARRPVESNGTKNVKSQQSLEPKKSISLALQAKANVQKREGLNHRAQSLRSQPNTERNAQKNPVSSNVLKQNNQKQNSLVDRGKSSPQTRKPVSQKSSSKIISENTKTSHKKEPYSTTRRKRSVEDSDHNNNIHAEKNNVRDRSYKNNRSDVISFTFTAPIARPMMSNNSFLSNNEVIDGDALSTLLEKKLRELTCNTPSVSQDSLAVTESETRDDSSYGVSSYDHQKPDQDEDIISRDDSSYEFSTNDHLQLMNKQQKLELGQNRITRDDYEYRKFLRDQEPSPNSVLEPSFVTESCNSSDTLDSCKQNSTSVQAQELLATTSRNPTPMDVDTELLDSASSITTLTKWEPDYIKEVLSDIDTMFADFTIGKTRKIVNPRVFDRLEIGRPNEQVAKLRRELIFNCVSECMEMRCRVWTKGLATVRRQEQLSREVYQEIADWEEMKDSMVDELVDKDMSGCAYKKWLDFDVEAFEIGVEIESRLLDSLINEVVDDILEL
ncbi:DUF3741-associated sequence motif protein [Artemisia annua]|uniref:DUF3741-associated sequence motif protein n=1 Tax=Artemisia annua TaxID=35608 RepID=A0A2U1MZX3_ARTAN|nr:DUF3741-associated sequence motif protein [Artemisia annua]